ncbi:hypothetical protein [Occultella glacieicola]|nr:hypothetical protein [Occultella glacieicola]
MSPDPTAVHPIPAFGRVVFLRPLVTAPMIPARPIRQRFSDADVAR